MWVVVVLVNGGHHVYITGFVISSCVFTCLSCIVYCVLCLVSLSCLTTTTPRIYTFTLCGGGMHGGGGSHLCSVLCALWSVVCDLVLYMRDLVWHFARQIYTTCSTVPLTILGVVNTMVNTMVNTIVNTMVVQWWYNSYLHLLYCLHLLTSYFFLLLTSLRSHCSFVKMRVCG